MVSAIVRSGRTEAAFIFRMTRDEADRHIDPIRRHALLQFKAAQIRERHIKNETSGVGAGVPIRALEPIDGIPSMRKNRGVRNLRDLTQGPGRLTDALDIDRRLDGIDLCRTGALWLARDSHGDPEIARSARIGLSRETDRPLRFYVHGNRFVGGPKILNH